MSENAHLESVVADLLSKANVLFVHRRDCEDTTKGCSFYLPLYHVYLECAEYGSERAYSKIRAVDNAMLIQGPGALTAFLALARRDPKLVTVTLKVDAKNGQVERA